MNAYTTVQKSLRVAGALLLMAAATPAVSAQREWVALDAGLSAASGEVFGFSIAADPRVNPVLALESVDSGGVSVMRWHQRQWEGLGPTFPGASGPMLAIDAERRLYLCTSGKYAGTGAPNVFRWKHGAWTAVGGDIAAEAGYRSVAKHVVDACGGIAVTENGDPVVTWTAQVGAKSWAVFAARWDADSQRWLPMGDGAIAGGRSVSTQIAVDARDRPYLATTTMVGAGLGRVTTAQVWRWDGQAWGQLGPEIPGGESAVVGVHENQPYLALHYVERDAGAGTVAVDEMRVMRWRRGAWEALPSAGVGTGRPSLDFSSSGRPVIGFVESADGGQILAARVMLWSGKNWRNVGEAAASTRCDLPSCYPEASLDLSLDAWGRPILVWKERSYQVDGDGNWLPVHRLQVKRYGGELP
jgi:hypothetical protein